MKYVYHSSPIQNLKTIETRIGTHHKPWIYAFDTLEHSAVFLSSWHDGIFNLSFFNGKPVLREKFQDALLKTYKGNKGSIYKIDGTDFRTGMTSFNVELICEHDCPVIEEVKVDDALAYILGLEKLGEITIIRYSDVSI